MKLGQVLGDVPGAVGGDAADKPENRPGTGANADLARVNTWTVTTHFHHLIAQQVVAQQHPTVPARSSRRLAACLNLGWISGKSLSKCSWNGCPSARGIRSQFHFVAAIAVKRTAYQQMAGQFHLADHAHLRKTSVAMLVAGGVVTRTVLRRVGRSPDTPSTPSKRRPAQVG